MLAMYAAFLAPGDAGLVLAALVAGLAGLGVAGLNLRATHTNRQVAGEAREAAHSALTVASSAAGASTEAVRQLYPDGGYTVRDVLDRIENRLERQDQRTDRMDRRAEMNAAQTAESAGRLDSVVAGVAQLVDRLVDVDRRFAVIEKLVLPEEVEG